MTIPSERNFETFEDALDAIDRLKIDLLFTDEAELSELPPKQPMADQFYLMAINHLELAYRNLKLAHYNYMQGR